jgi:molybdopterin converting factor small subunit
MIRIKIKVYAELQAYLPGKQEESIMQIREGSKVRDLMESLKMPEHRVMLILRNGKKAKEEDPLSDGDAVFFYPVIGGG